MLTVESNSPAEKGGLKEGDVIVALDGELVEGVDVLHRLLSEERINIWTSLTILRGTQKLAMRLLPELRQSEDKRLP